MHRHLLASALSASLLLASGPALAAPSSPAGAALEATPHAAGPVAPTPLAVLAVEEPAGTAPADAASVAAPDLPLRAPAQRTGAIGTVVKVVLITSAIVVVGAVAIVALFLWDLTH